MTGRAFFEPDFLGTHVYARARVSQNSSYETFGHTVLKSQFLSINSISKKSFKSLILNAKIVGDFSAKMVDFRVFIDIEFLDKNLNFKIVFRFLGCMKGFIYQSFFLKLKLTINWNPSRLRHITDSPKTEFSTF